MTTVTDFDTAQAALAASLPNYEERPQQTALAHFIESHIANRGHVIAEAGCGTGKSLSYLIPAITSGKRVIVSTATKALQDQIANKDLPFLREHLGIDFEYAILKGRSNYLCRAELEKLAQDDPSVAKRVYDVLNAHEEEGFLAESEDFDIDKREWSKLSTSANDCPGKKKCPFGETCFAEKARSFAKSANVVVVNHSLFLTDLQVRAASDGNANILGDYDVVIFDEAHEIEEYATNVFQRDLRESQLNKLGSDLASFARKIKSVEAKRLEDAVPTFTGQVITLWGLLEEGRLQVPEIQRIGEPIAELHDSLINLGGILDTVKTDDRKLSAQKNILLRRISNHQDTLFGLVAGSFESVVRWVDTETFKGRTNKVVHSAPISVAPILGNLLFQAEDEQGRRVGPTAILVSATIEVAGSFDFVAGRLGIESYDGLNVGTPFDFQTQAKLFIPSYLPDPSGKGRTQWEAASVALMGELVKASDGRALLLFTSTKQMRAAYENLSRTLPYTCFVQGQGTNKELAAKFVEDHHSVLFATRSFFTGVDFQGDVLSLVVIDKLPFPVPTEPVFQARCEAVKRAGGNDFGDFTIPGMALVLKQGFGRLIRHRNDRGVVAILDPRITGKSYGKKILRSLPDAPLVETFGEVEAFFAQEAA